MIPWHHLNSVQSTLTHVLLKLLYSLSGIKVINFFRDLWGNCPEFVIILMHLGTWRKSCTLEAHVEFRLVQLRGGNASILIQIDAWIEFLSLFWGNSSLLLSLNNCGLILPLAIPGALDSLLNCGYLSLHLPLWRPISKGGILLDLRLCSSSNNLSPSTSRRPSNGSSQIILLSKCSQHRLRRD